MMRLALKKKKIFYTGKDFFIRSTGSVGQLNINRILCHYCEYQDSRTDRFITAHF